MKSYSKSFVFKEACDLIINWTIKDLWDILVNKFIFMAELSLMKTLILQSILCFCNKLIYVLEEDERNVII